jgi:hypothetical protein
MNAGDIIGKAALGESIGMAAEVYKGASRVS